MMTRKASLIVGIALIAIGLIKAATHTSAGEILTLPGCAGGTFVIDLGVRAAAQPHCWGCHVALVGAAVVFVALWLIRSDSARQT